MLRKLILSTLLFVIAAVYLPALQSPVLAQASIESIVAIDVYKDPTCGCCSNWIEHMKLSDFESTVYHPADLNGLKLQHGIRPELQSCHTAVTKEGFVFEGHVPAKFIQQFLAAPPVDAKGLLVPGMPLGSPGMEVGGRFTPYDIILLKTDGSTSVYARVESVEAQF